MPTQAPYDEKDLLERVAAGDETAFRKVFHQYWDNIYGVALMLTKSEAMAEDMVQEIFVKIWQKKDRLPGVVNFTNYLFIIARNHIISELRRLSTHAPFQEELIRYFRDSALSPEQELLKKESEELIQQAIERLPGQQQAVYLLGRDQGLSHEQIAERLGISKNTVRNHMARALQSIRAFLQDHSAGLLLLIGLCDAFLPIGQNVSPL
jgi:RNA polymerase sigma-70 factor (family 1)